MVVPSLTALFASTVLQVLGYLSPFLRPILLYEL
jgi:hypothetical protein